MKQEVKTLDDKTLDISIEEFDALDGNHTFSKEYQKRKRKIWKEYRRTVYAARRNYAKIAAAASVLIITVPVAVNAANDNDFFNRIWGSSGKKNIEAHEEIYYDEEKGTSCSIAYPQKEYVDIAPDKAEKLIGENIAKKNITKTLNDDTKLTILSAVSDGQAAVVEFTLEREGGVNALNYDQLTNEEGGAWFSDESTFDFHYKYAHDSIFVDLEQSTDELLHCYDYMVLDSNTSRLLLETQEYSCTRKDMIEKCQDGNADFTKKTQTISIPLKSDVKTVDYVNADGGIVRVSPLSIKIDMSTGLGLSLEESQYPDNADPEDLYDASKDPGSIYYVAITDKKGATYIVTEQDNDKHTCNVPIDNTTYACGDEGSHLTYTFNRLVDTDEITSIIVNDTEYVLK
ncbi:MAG: hypothetical protein K2J67_11505 [Lachnospiraceae bacterium]|nr:hypothetical protein [Lachnospiraceae bacterium]